MLDGAVARNETVEWTEYLNKCRYVLHDRDQKFCLRVAQHADCGRRECLALRARSPNLKSFVECWVRSIKEECLSRLILFGENLLLRVVPNYTAGRVPVVSK